MRISDWSSDVCSSDLYEAARDDNLAVERSAGNRDIDRLFFGGGRRGRGRRGIGLLARLRYGARRNQCRGQEQEAGECVRRPHEESPLVVNLKKGGRRPLPSPLVK